MDSCPKLGFGFWPFFSKFYTGSIGSFLIWASNVFVLAIRKNDPIVTVLVWIYCPTTLTANEFFVVVMMARENVRNVNGAFPPSKTLVVDVVQTWKLDLCRFFK